MKVISFFAFLTVVVISGIAFFIFQSSKKDVSVVPSQAPSTQAAVSGKFDLNGPIPTGATISVAQRLADQDSFTVFDPGITAVDGSSWNFSNAKENSSYEIQASLKINGEVATTSAILSVSAPAIDEVLTINYAPKTAAVVPSPGPITGTLDLNGYIPSGAIVTLQRKGPSDNNFVLIGNPFTASDKTNWIWKEPRAGVTYQLKAFLSSNGSRIGESDAITITAPASGESLRINSTAKAPVATSAPVSSSAISGSVNLNGASPKGGSIVILQRTPPSKGDFQVAVDGVQSVNASQWTWNQAVAGAQYELVAVLKDGNKNDVATSQSLIGTAPASNEVFTINSTLSLQAPTQATTFACVGKNSNNTWNVNVNYPTISGANSYWFQIGTSNGGSELLNTVQNASNNPSQTINSTFNDSVTYYAKYAYSYNSNASFNSAGFSAFSNTNSFKCPQ